MTGSVWTGMESGGRTRTCVPPIPMRWIWWRRAVELAERLPPSTDRYYFWPDDGGAWCHCDRCRCLAPADQQVLVMNAILTALRSVRPDARLACLAYLDC